MSNGYENGSKKPKEGIAGLSWRESVVVGGLALSLPTMLFGPPALGYMLDQWLGTTWIIWVFGIMALIATAVDVYMILKRAKLLQ